MPPLWLMRCCGSRGFRTILLRQKGRPLKYLYRAGRYFPALADEMLREPWLRDEITADEATVIKYLYWMVRYKDEPDERVTETAINILSMPFLDSVESPDALAVRSLRRLVRSDADVFLEIMSHPTLSDGITDEEAKIVTLLGSTHKYRPQSVDVLLGGVGVYVEERVIDLPHSGEVLLAIIRLGDHSNSNMDYLEHAVRHHEGFMGEPLPTNYVAWYFDDWRSSGAHYGTHITSNPKRDPPVGEYWRGPRHAAHEVAHYYWRDSRPWISEGGADMLTILSENARVERPLEVNRDQCTLFSTISELEAADAETGSNEYGCAYRLGQRLFLDLYHTLGKDAFQQRFRSLYLKRLRDDPTDGCEGTDLDICHLVAAFKADVSEAQAAKVDEIVARWYGPLP